MEANPTQPTIPKLVYMSFKRKSGNPIAFGAFMKKIRVDMEKFADLPPSMEECE